MMKKIIIILLLALALFIFHNYSAKADIFSIHLSYNSQTKKLQFDSSMQENVSLDKERVMYITEFLQNQDTIRGNYIIQLFDNEDNIILSIELNPVNGNFDYEIPYYSIANRLEIIYKITGKEILKADLSKFLTCDSNGICEFEKGENYNTCMVDCASSKVNYSEKTKALLKENSGIIKDPKTGAILLEGGYPKPLNEESETTGATSDSNNKMWSIIIIIAISIPTLIAIYFIVRKKIINK